MSVPTYDQFIEPVLRYLADHPEGAPAPVVHDAAANSLGLSEQDREALVPSGTQRLYKNRAGWAHDRLKRAGLSTTPKHGFWKINAAGAIFVKEHAAAFTPELVANLATNYLNVILKPTSVPSGSSQGGNGQATAGSLEWVDGAPVVHTPNATPEELLDQAISDLRAAANSELRERLATVSPSFFEVIVLDVLHRLGYGANRSDLQQVGGSGDAGIDGVISLDKLGLEKVYVQAKRWKSVVGRPELQGFYGALAGQKAKKGVFITTSAYTTQAVDFARSVDGIVLIDGERLASLMIDNEVGVTSRIVRVPKLDSDYFDEGGG